MPTKRRKLGAQRLRRTDQMPLSVRWWLHNGQSIGIAEAIALDFGDHDAWQVTVLHFAHLTAPGSKFWTRADLREAGYGAAIDAHIAARRMPADGWRRPLSADVIPLERKL